MTKKERRATLDSFKRFSEAIRVFDRDRVPAGVQPSAHRAAYDALVSIRDELADKLKAAR